MYDDQLEPDGDESPEPSAEDEEIDLDIDQVEVREEALADGPIDDEYAADDAQRIANAELDNVTDEFVDLMNARDFDAMRDLLSAEVIAEFLDGTSREEVITGLGDLVIRHPTLLATRADLGADPIVALWTFDTGADRFDPFGFLFVELDEAAEGLVERMSYVDELDSDDVVVEVPERADLPEWEDWSELDED